MFILQTTTSRTVAVCPRYLCQYLFLECVTLEFFIYRLSTGLGDIIGLGRSLVHVYLYPSTFVGTSELGLLRLSLAADLSAVY